MPDIGALFISELLRAANQTDKLTRLECARLLQQAAATLRDYRDRQKPSANVSEPIDVAHEWSEMARLIELFSAEEVSKTLLHAVACIKAARVLAEVNWASEPDSIGASNGRGEVRRH
jgi:hypothetical protein